MTSRLLRCKDNHPTMVKFRKLCEYAEELGLQISWEAENVVVQVIPQGYGAEAEFEIKKWCIWNTCYA